MAAAVNAMTALGAMFAMACAASSGPDITPCRSPASSEVLVGTVMCGPRGLGVIRGQRFSGHQEGAQGLAGLEIGEGCGGLTERPARPDQCVELELTVHVAVDERGDVDRRPNGSVVRAEDALIG